MPAIPALKRQKPEKFRVIFGYVESVLVWVAWEPVPKNQNQMRGSLECTFLSVNDLSSALICT